MNLLKKEENLILIMSNSERKILSDCLEFFISGIHEEAAQEKMEEMLDELNSDV